MLVTRPHAPGQRRSALRIGATIAGLTLAAAMGLVSVPAGNAASNGVWAITSPPEFGGGSEPITLTVPPAQQAQSYVQLENLTRSPLTISVVPSQGQRSEQVAAFRPTADGEEVPSPDTARWLTLASSDVGVAALSKQRIDVDVRVPAGTPSGDYVASVLGVTQGAFNPLTRAREQLGQQIIVYIRVEGPLTNKLASSTIQVDGKRAEFSVANEGNTRLNPTATLVARGANGQPLDVEPRAIGSLEPGADASVVFDLPAAPTSIAVEITSDAPPVQQVWPPKPIDAVVVQPGEFLPPIPDEGNSDDLILVWVAVGAFVLVLLLISGLSRRRRRRRMRAAMARAAAMTPSPSPGLTDAATSAPLVALAVPGPPPPPAGFASAPAAPSAPVATARTVISGDGSRSVIAPRP